MSNDEIIEALRTNHGNVRAAAAALKISPQGIYHHINTAPAVGRALKAMRKSFEAAKKESAPKRPGFVDAVRQLTVSEDEIAVRAMADASSPRVAARALLVERLMAVLGWSERKVLAELRSKKTAAAAFERHLPAPALARTTEPHEVLSVSLTEAQLAWMAAQPEGTAGQLLAAVNIWPTVNPGAKPFKQTTYSLPLRQLERLREAANAQDATPQALFRAVVERARLAKVARKAAAAPV